MIGILGLLVSLFALMYFAYRGINVLILAPICATVAILFQPEIYESGSGMTLAYYTQVFMGSLGKYLVKYFPIFLLGSIFGKLMNDGKAAKVIGESISNKLGPDHAILATVIACSVLTYGGVSLFVVAFCIYPISASLFAKAKVHRKFIPGAIALGSFSYTMVAFPGTPSVQNAIPMPFFGTTAFAAPGLGVIASIIMFSLGMLWLKYHARSSTVPYEEAPEVIHEGVEPPIWLAIAPLFIVIGFNYALSEYIIPKWDVTYLDSALFGSTNLKSVQGLWSIILSLLAAVIFILLFFRKYQKKVVNSVNEGTMGSLLPIFNTASEVGYGTVIASLAAFSVLKEAVLSISPNNPIVSEAIAINALAGITGSASGGMSIGLEMLGAKYLEMAQVMNINPELLHRVASMSSGGLDTLPHNGAVITLFAICKLTHRDSYLDIFMTSVFIPVIATIAIVFLGSTFGSF